MSLSYSVLFYFTEGDESEERNELQENIFTPHSVDSVRLTNFLQQAGQVVLCSLFANRFTKLDQGYVDLLTIVFAYSIDN